MIHYVRRLSQVRDSGYYIMWETGREEGVGRRAMGEVYLDLARSHVQLVLAMHRVFARHLAMLCSDTRRDRRD